MTNRSIFDEDVVEDYLKIKRKQVRCLGEALDEIHSSIQNLKDENERFKNGIMNICDIPESQLNDLITKFQNEYDRRYNEEI